MTGLKDTGLSKPAITALIKHGIDTVEKLCSFALEDLEQLPCLGPTALFLIAKLKESDYAITTAPTVTPAPETAAEVKARAERAASLMKEPPPGEGTVTTKSFTIELQFRHAEWITRAAEAYAQTEEQVIQQAIRQAYSRDPYKAGATAVSGSILKHDNPHRQPDP